MLPLFQRNGVYFVCVIYCFSGRTIYLCFQEAGQLELLKKTSICGSVTLPLVVPPGEHTLIFIRRKTSSGHLPDF